MERTQHIATGIQGLKGNEILAMMQQTEEGLRVAIKPLSTALKLSWGRQAEKIQSDPRFSCTHMCMTGADGKQYEMLCLPAEQIPMWINSINSNKVCEEKRAALLELHKFFGYALNEFSRGRYVTQEQHSKDMSEMREQLQIALKTIEALVQENTFLKQSLESVWRARDFRGSAASYDMHATKAMKKAERLIKVK